MRNRILSLIVIGIMLMSIAAPTRAQTTAVDPATLQYQALAGEAARNILTLAGSRDFNSMYDLMHPDSKALAPRSAVVGLFDAAYSQAQAGVPQVISIEIVDYTWPVTGQTYSPAARVTFVQPIVDQNGQQTFVQDSIYLAPDANGTWGWFFGNSAEMVQSAIDTYGNTNTTTTGNGSSGSHHPIAGRRLSGQYGQRSGRLLARRHWLYRLCLPVPRCRDRGRRRHGAERLWSGDDRILGLLLPTRHQDVPRRKTARRSAATRATTSRPPSSSRTNGHITSRPASA